MNIIERLEKTVTTAVLGHSDSVAHISLLNEFYAVLAMRLAMQEVQVALAGNTLFEQLWPQQEQRQLIIRELATTHHINESTTNQLTANAAHLAYQELENLANDQFLPIFLQAQASDLRRYLPVWAPLVISTSAHLTETSDSVTNSSYIGVIEDKLNVTLDEVIVIDDKWVSDEIQVNPSAYHTSKLETKVHPTNQRNDLVVRLLLLIIALAALALLWFLVIQPKYMPTPTQLPITEPVIATTRTAPATTVAAIDLVVAVDDSGNLYTCTATVGNINLQNVLKQALSVSFAEQASICELSIQQGVATNLSNINLESLPDVFTLLRSVSFARLQLQDGSISLAAPDEMLLQQLVSNMRTLLPEITVVTATPMPLLENDNVSAMGEIDSNTISKHSNESNDYMNSYDNNPEINSNQNYQEADDDTGDTVISAPPRNDSNFDNNGAGDNNMEVPSGPISLSEANSMANSIIVAEPAQGGRPIDR